MVVPHVYKPSNIRIQMLVPSQASLAYVRTNLFSICWYPSVPILWKILAMGSANLLGQDR